VLTTGTTSLASAPTTRPNTTKPTIAVAPVSSASSYPDTTIDHPQTDVWERASSLPSLLTVTLAAGRRANVADAQACQGRPEQHRNLARRADVGLAVVVENSADTP
jgi:hypothetical protein